MRKIVNQFASVAKLYNLQIFWICILLVIVAGTFYSFYLGNQLRFLPDESDYYVLATNLLNHHFYSLDGVLPTAYRPPGYPLLITVFTFLGAQVIHLRIINFILLALCLVVMNVILKNKSTPIAASIGILIVLFYPVIFYTAGQLYPQTLATLLFLLSILLVTRRERTWWSNILAGVALGYLVLTVPIFFFSIFVIGGWIWYFERLEGIKGFVISTLIAILIIGLWSFRNFSLFNTWFFVSTNSGENLLLGNSENTQPNIGQLANINKYRKESANMSEVERDQYFRTEAIHYIQTHPEQSVKMYLLKLLNYFNFRNELVTKAEESPIKDIIMFLTYVPLLLIFILRLIMGKSEKISPFEWLLVILYFSSAMVSAIFFSRIRFRLPFDFVLIMLVAIFLGNVIVNSIKAGKPVSSFC
jgi:hypothetical protein